MQGNFPHPPGGFPHLRALWGNAVPFPLPVDHSYFGPPRGLPWVGPVIDTMFAGSSWDQQLIRAGKPLPVHKYSEDSSPYASHWWPESIRCLHRQASQEEQNIKDRFARLFPYHPVVHPDRATRAPNFLRENARLNTELACCQAIFFIRTRVQEGITASDAAQEGSQSFHREIETAEAAAAAVAYTEALFSDEFLCAWLDRAETDVHLWGTPDDPRNPPPAPPQILGGWSSGSAWGTGGWGSGGGWGGGWNAVTLNGGWGGWNAAPSRKTRRWFPRIYGFRRMGAVFREPRPVGWTNRRWQRRFGWLRRFERTWRHQESAMLLLSSLRRSLLSSSYM